MLPGLRMSVLCALHLKRVCFCVFVLFLLFSYTVYFFVFRRLSVQIPRSTCTKNNILKKTKTKNYYTTLYGKYPKLKHYRTVFPWSPSFPFTALHLYDHIPFSRSHTSGVLQPNRFGTTIYEKNKLVGPLYPMLTFFPLPCPPRDATLVA